MDAGSASRCWASSHQRHLDQRGGGFNLRKITAGKSLSLHSFGIAIDWISITTRAGSL